MNTHLSAAGLGRVLAPNVRLLYAISQACPARFLMDLAICVQCCTEVVGTSTCQGERIPQGLLRHCSRGVLQNPITTSGFLS